jgi:LacI family transcriptional regulator
MVTITDIAHHLGLSNQVVSKVLHGGSTTVRASEATRRRIEAAASQLGYRPNGSAKAMRTKRFGTVCILQSAAKTKSILPPLLMDSIQQALAERDLHMMLAKLPDQKLVSEGVVPRILREWACDGLLINYNHMIPSQMIELIRRNNVPAIWLNSKQQANCVYPDDHMVGRMAAERLLQAGHRAIAYADFSHGSFHNAHYSTIDRFTGAAEVLAGAGLPLLRMGSDALVPQAERFAHARARLTPADRPTAIIAYTHHEARAIWSAALSLGLRLPEDLALIAIHDAPLLDMGVAIDTVVIPEREMGRLAVEMLVRRLETQGDFEPAVALPPTYVAGQTCDHSQADTSGSM